MSYSNVGNVLHLKKPIYVVEKFNHFLAYVPSMCSIIVVTNNNREKLETYFFSPKMNGE